MAQEEQNQKCSNSSSGTCGDGENVVRSFKKQKAKKIPQRGLGVAQLERIRLGEQQKRDGGGTVVLPPSTSSTPSSTKSSSLSVPIPPNYHPSSQSSPSSIPFPPADHIPSPNLIFRSSSSSSSSSSSLLQNNEVLNSNTSTVPLTNPLGWSTVPIHHHGHYNLENEIARLDPGIAFRSNMNNSLPYESIPIWPLPGLMHRAHQYQQPSSMVNVSSTTPSSVINFQQMEPPSNQSHYGNYIPMWPEDEKMVGMKRAYPFSLDNFSSLNYKFPPTVLPLSRSEDSTSCSSGHRLNSEPCYPIYREGSNSKRNIKENGVSNGGFLSLAPPTTTSPMCQTSKFRHPPPSLASNNSEFPSFDSLPYQGRVEDPLFQPGRPSGSNQYWQPYYSFFPQAMARTSQVTSTANNFNGGEVGHDQSVDLNLKL